MFHYSVRCFLSGMHWIFIISICTWVRKQHFMCSVSEASPRLFIYRECVYKQYICFTMNDKTLGCMRSDLSYLFFISIVKRFNARSVVSIFIELTLTFHSKHFAGKDIVNPFFPRHIKKSVIYIKPLCNTFFWFDWSSLHYSLWQNQKTITCSKSHHTKINMLVETYTTLPGHGSFSSLFALIRSFLFCRWQNENVKTCLTFALGSQNSLPQRSRKKKSPLFKSERTTLNHYW